MTKSKFIEYSKQMNREQLERLKQAISLLGLTKTEFSKKLGYKSPHPIYMILNESNKISDSFIQRLELSTLKINSEWLITGKGEPISKDYSRLDYGREIFHNGKVVYPRRTGLRIIKKIANKFSSHIYGDLENLYFTVEAQPLFDFGITLAFTEFSMEETIHYTKKNFIGIEPNWKVVGFYDSWRVGQENERCQNDLSSYFIEKFETSIREILMEIKDEFEFPKDDLFNPSNTTHEGFITIFEQLPNGNSN